MKTLLKILTSSAVMLGLVWGFVSCKGEPKEIPFIEYSLDGSSCEWKNLNYDESVIIINSNEKLEGYIDCSDGAYPEIDFSKNTLLLASGYGSGVEQANATAFLQNAVNKYSLEITHLINLTLSMDKWDTAVLVPKISNKTNIILTIKFKP